MNRTFAPIEALVDELARCGVRHAVASPGSRNAPLLLTLAAERRIATHSVLDERSAGFVALGLAKATGTPVAVTCTSGTAAANLMPAVAEAHEARVPLIVLTADRPPELRDVGAGQSIDQVKLFGSAVKWFVEVGSHDASRTTAVHHRALGCRAYHTARSGRPGPVHLNFPLREPLSPIDDRTAGDPATWAGRADGRPWVERRESPLVPDAALVDELAALIGRSPRGAIVAGAVGEEIAEPAARLAAACGWPLLAEPTSGVRCGPHDRSGVVSHYDLTLRSTAFAAGHRPDLVLRLGDTPTSKPLRGWLEETAQVVVDPHGAWHEPTRTAETIVGAGPAATCLALAEALEATPPRGRDEGWLRSWLDADALVPSALAAAPDPFEPKAYAALASSLPDGANFFVSSSMPIRWVESYLPSGSRRLRFLANRGANGIDGVVSSAVGAALASDGPTVVLIGELALLHDLGGLIAARDLGVDLTVICADNGGGGIFDFLPVAERAEAAAYERLIATPRRIELDRVAAMADLEFRDCRKTEEVVTAAARPGLVRLELDRAAAVAAQRSLVARVVGELGG